MLQRQAIWQGGAPSTAGPAASTGFKVLDAELPGGGWPVGGLIEVFCRHEGLGEMQLALPALAALTAAGHRVAWLAPPYLPYAPALRAAGVRLQQLTVVRAPGRRDALWAAEQALRANAFHALLAWLPQANYAELRRLAVAAQAGPGFALVFRPPEAAGESSPAVLRLSLEPSFESSAQPLAVRILKRRGTPMSMPLRLPIERPAHALGRAPLPPVQAPGAVARACAA
ncbi:MAG: translesion DNA synthesis-associated protein ImuA [Burkholderiales bacterium]